MKFQMYGMQSLTGLSNICKVYTMKMRIKTGVIFVLSSFLLLTLSGCYAPNQVDDTQTSDRNSGTDSRYETIDQWNCAWYVYWDTDVREELSAIKANVASLCMFSCFFDDDAKIYIPQDFSELQKLAKDLKFPMVYLSFTNDVQHTDGSVTQKDTEILRRLWTDKSRMKKTADDLLATVRSMGVEGIEIDFENIQDSDLWSDYICFLNVLWEKAKTENLSLRVVLGVNAPIENKMFPIGPSYTVMCYNLYGTHSGPGPKADAAFLRETAGKFSKLTNVSYALSTGGFEWDANDKVTRSLTQKMAEELLSEYACMSERDQASQALYYNYQEDGEEFTVWYADAQTLSAWRKVLRDTDPDAEFDLWRIGGNLWK